MALWHTLTRNAQGIWAPDGDAWDDGETRKPGEAGWSVAKIMQRAAGRLFNYIGTPNWTGQ